MLRVLYNAGPGNAFETFQRWQDQERDLVNSHVAYSGQMLEACARRGAALMITCTHEGGEEQRHGNVKIVPRTDLSRGKSGISYHRSIAAKALQNIRDAIDFNADVLIISEDSNPSHYQALLQRGVRIVQSLHTRLWIDGRKPSFLQRLRLKGFAKAYSSGEISVLSASDVITEQVAALTKGKMPPVLEFLPLYYPEHYADIPPPALDPSRLDIMFIGRIEENKGVFDLVSIAHLLRARNTDFRFQICGEGSALDRMRKKVSDQNLERYFLFHGWCDRDRLRAVMTQCQATIVPTRSDFVEGFNQVIVESVLAHRPIIASDMCPAVSYVGEAAVMVKADDIQGYADAISNLSHDMGALAGHIRACTGAGRRFLDPDYSFATALDEVFSAVKEKRAVRTRRIDPKAL